MRQASLRCHRAGRSRHFGPSPWDRIDELKATSGQAQSDAQRATLTKGSVRRQLLPDVLRQFSQIAGRRMRGPDGDYRRDHLRTLARRVEVAKQEVRIIGSKTKATDQKPTSSPL
jgi:hypothetical protein